MGTSSHLHCMSFRQFGPLRPLWTLRCFKSPS